MMESGGRTRTLGCLRCVAVLKLEALKVCRFSEKQDRVAFNKSGVVCTAGDDLYFPLSTWV